MLRYRFKNKKEKLRVLAKTSYEKYLPIYLSIEERSLGWVV